MRICTSSFTVWKTCTNSASIRSVSTVYIYESTIFNNTHNLCSSCFFEDKCCAGPLVGQSSTEPWVCVIKLFKSTKRYFQNCYLLFWPLAWNALSWICIAYFIRDCRCSHTCAYNMEWGKIHTKPIKPLCVLWKDPVSKCAQLLIFCQEQAMKKK